MLLPHLWLAYRAVDNSDNRLDFVPKIALLKLNEIIQNIKSDLIIFLLFAVFQEYFQNWIKKFLFVVPSTMHDDFLNQIENAIWITEQILSQDLGEYWDQQI